MFSFTFYLPQAFPETLNLLSPLNASTFATDWLMERNRKASKRVKLALTQSSTNLCGHFLPTKNTI